MKVTLHHPASKEGYPVILDDDGTVMSDQEGIAAILQKVGMSYPEFAAVCGIKPITLRQYGNCRVITANVLNMLRLVLEDVKAVRAKHVPPPLNQKEKRVLALLKKGDGWAEIGRKMGFTRQQAFQVGEIANGKIAKVKGG